jgi:competence protein ComEC
VTTVTHIAALPGARVVIAPPPWPAVIVDFALVGLAAFLLWRKYPRSAAIAIACGIACVIFAPRTLPQQSARITMLDAGQGDAILVQSARGRSILIDTGGRLERGLTADGNSPAEAIGERIVVPTLFRMGVTRLDAIILTHPHGEHAGGLAPILRTLSVGVILDSGQVYGGRAYNDGISESRRKHVPIVIARCGDRLSLDEIHLAILSPCTLATGGKNDE